MVQCKHNMGKVIELPMGRFMDRNIQKRPVEINRDEPVSIMDIMSSKMVLSNIMYSHNKTTGLFFTEQGFITHMKYSGLIQMINDSTIWKSNESQIISN